MKKLLIMAFAASAFAACCNNGGVACDARNLDRAKATLDSIYAHYGVAENRLLRENYPFNVDYTASYLASADQARPNPYSYLWPFSGTLSAVNTILEADASYRSVLDGRVLPGLAEYLDTTRMPAAYASYINTASASDRFYDDFDLQFVPQGTPSQGLFHYYEMSPDSPQYISCDIYSGRIKAQKAYGDPYKQIARYLEKAVAEHRDATPFDQFVSYTGHGSYSNSLIAWRDEQQLLDEQFGNVFSRTHNAKFLRYSM